MAGAGNRNPATRTGTRNTGVSDAKGHRTDVRNAIESPKIYQNFPEGFQRTFLENVVDIQYLQVQEKPGFYKDSMMLPPINTVTFYRGI